LDGIDIDSWGKDSRDTNEENEIQKQKHRDTKITRKKSPGKYEILKKDFEEIKEEIKRINQEIFQKFENLQGSKPNFDLPEEIRNDLIALLKADYRRFINWNYTGYVQYVENIAGFFKIKLTKPKEKESKKKKEKKKNGKL